MGKTSQLRVALGAGGVSIWSSEIFGDSSADRVRDFLTRAFSVREVEGVELRRAKAFGRIRYPSSSNPAQVWKKLSLALGGGTDASSVPIRRVDAAGVFLDLPGARAVRVTRIGESLSTWRVRHVTDSTLQLSHPALRNRRDVVFRLEEELAAILGVEDFRASALTAGVSIRFDKEALNAERLVRSLEKAWPRLLDGLDGPPSRKRLVAAVGLTGLAFTGQYVVPALRPLAVAGVAVYSAPNVVKAAKELARGELGLSALYSAGLALMLTSGKPFSAALIASLMQLWPQLTRQKIVRVQRRLFAAQRRRPAWARVPQADGLETEVNIEDLGAGDFIVVRTGEIIPADGVVEDGLARVIDDVLLGGDHADDKSQGDAVAAGAFVRDGTLTIRVERTGADTAASYIDSLLPHSAVAGMPSSLEAERIANRNAKPALALAALSLGLTRTLRPSQVLIRPDYATAPRLSAQLSQLHGIGRALQEGVLFRNPAALDRLSDPEVFVVDDTAGLEHKQVEVSAVQTAQGVDDELVVGYALAAHHDVQSHRGRALTTFASKRRSGQPRTESIEQSAGVTRFRDSRGSLIEVATLRYLAAAKIEIPPRFQIVPVRRVEADEHPSLRPLWVLRDGALIGVVSFARTGDIAGKELVTALHAQNPKARLVYLSRRPEAETRTLATALGIKFAYGDLDQVAKADFIRGLGRKTVWIGDGSDPDAKERIAASTVSISIGPLVRAPEDAADVLSPRKRLAGVIAVLAIARAHAARLEQDYRTVYAANLLGMSGAFVGRFTGLHAGLLSNASTGLIYARHAWDLNRLATTAEQKRVRLKGVVRG